MALFSRRYRPHEMGFSASSLWLEKVSPRNTLFDARGGGLNSVCAF